MVQIVLTPTITYDQFEQILIAHSIRSNCDDRVDERKMIYWFGSDQVDAYADIYNVYHHDDDVCPICGLFISNVSYAKELYSKSIITDASIDISPPVFDLWYDRIGQIGNGELYPYCMSMTLISNIAIDYAIPTFVGYKHDTPLELYLITNNEIANEYYSDDWQRLNISINSTQTNKYDLCELKTELGKRHSFSYTIESFSIFC